MIRISLVAFLVFFTAISCTSTGSKNKTEGADAQQVAVGVGMKLSVDTLSSTIEWKGSKPGGQHLGTIGIKEGNLVVDGDKLVSGSFVIDMNTIIDKDLTDQKSRDMLVGHLKSADFFDVALYSESMFTITKADPIEGNDSVNYRISGNLKMKDIEKNIQFDAKIIKEGDVYTAQTVPFTIDRTQWNVKYGSKNFFADLKDKFIDDNIELQLKIVAKAE